MKTKKKRSPADLKVDRAVKSAIKKTNATLPKGLELREFTCPNCGSPDVDLSHDLNKGMKCWDCGTIYRIPGTEQLVWK